MRRGWSKWDLNLSNISSVKAGVINFTVQDSCSGPTIFLLNKSPNHSLSSLLGFNLVELSNGKKQRYKDVQHHNPATTIHTLIYFQQVVVPTCWTYTRSRVNVTWHTVHCPDYGQQSSTFLELFWHSNSRDIKHGKNPGNLLRPISESNWIVECAISPQTNLLVTQL